MNNGTIDSSCPGENMRPSGINALPSLSPETTTHLQNTLGRRLKEAADVCGEYDGSEKGDNGIEAVVDVAGQFEEWLNSTLGREEGPPRLSTDEERMAMLALFPDEPPRTVESLLQAASDNFNRILRESPGNINTLNLLIKKIEFVVLPPDGAEILRGNGEGSFKEPAFAQKFTELLKLLNENNVYLDDLIVSESPPPKNSFRKVGYYVVEIPRLNVQILVCNQIGEATFVIHGRFGMEKFSLGKKELGSSSPDGVVSRIEYGAGWGEKLKSELGLPYNSSSCPKVDVRKFDRIRDAIAREYTPEKWLSVDTIGRRNLSFCGLGFPAILTALGVPHEKNSPFTNLLHLEAAAKIYGEDHPLLSKRLATERENNARTEELGTDPKKWKAEIKRLYSFDEWMKRPPRIYGTSLLQIARIFGFGTDQAGGHANGLVFMRLTAKIFDIDTSEISPENLKDEKDEKLKKFKQCLYNLEKQAELKNDPEELKRIVRGMITPEEWAKRSCSLFGSFYVYGMGLYMIGGILGRKGIEHDDALCVIELGRDIFGDSPFILKAMSNYNFSVMDKDVLIKRFREKYPPAELAELLKTASDNHGVAAFLKGISFGKTGLPGMASIVGYNNKPQNSCGLFLKFCSLIYEPGDFDLYLRPLLGDFEFREKAGKDPAQWRNAILEKYNMEELGKFSTPRRREIHVHGLALTSLSRIFGISGNPFSNENYRKFLEKLAEKG